MATQISQKWKKVKLGDIVDFQYGYTASAQEENTGTKFLRITDIVPDLIDWKAVPHCAVDKKKLEQFKVKKGDILIARTGATAGYAKLIRREPEQSVFASYLIRLKIKDIQRVNPDFVGRVVESDVFKEFVAVHAGGSAQPHANAPVLKNFEMSIPDSQTQKQVGEMLSAYDDLIENANRRIKILEEIAQKIYTEWFINFRFPGFKTTKFNKNGLPDGWKMKSIGEKINVLRGRNITRKTVSEGSIPVVAGGMEPAYYHDASNATGPVVTISASGANSGYVKLYHQDIWASDCSYINEDVTDFVYFFYSLFKAKQTDVTHLQRGSAQPHVYPKDIMSLQALFPEDDAIIQDFECLISPLYLTIGEFSKQIGSLKKSRDLLIPQLVTGKLEVKI